MSKYVNADALLDKLPDDLPYKGSVRRVLIQAPAANVKPVVYGRWEVIVMHWSSDGRKHVIDACSICGEEGSDEFDFCPHCGADMRVGQNESN